MFAHVIAISGLVLITSGLALLFGNLGSTGPLGWPWGFGSIGLIPFLSKSEFRFVQFLGDVAVISAVYAAATLAWARVRHTKPTVLPGSAATLMLVFLLAPATSAPPRRAEGHLFAPTSSRRIEVGGWHEVPSATTSTLFGVAASSGSDAWAVGENGTVLHWDGDVWVPVESPLFADTHLLDVWASPDGQVWVVGQEPSEINSWGTHGIIVHHDDGDWRKKPVHSVRRLEGVSGSSATDVWAVGPDESFHWDGESWSNAAVACVKVIGLSAQRAWCSDYPGRVFRWDGASWTLVPSEAINTKRIWAVGDDEVWLAAGADGIRHFDGTHWTTAGGGYYSVDAIWGSGPNDIWAAGREPVIHGVSGSVLHWNGAEWRRWNTTLDHATVYALGGTATDDVWAVGADGRILHFRRSQGVEP